MKKINKFNLSAILLFSVLKSFAASYPTYWTVAKDGSGDFTTIQKAIDTCKSFPDERITIFIKNGTYHEKIRVHSWNTGITLKGENKDKTIITNNDFAGTRKNGTFYTYTVLVQANDTRLENLTIENSAGKVGQAVALHVETDRVVVKNCNLLGNQDTLYAAGENARQLYDSCYIEGTTDYIFGPGTAFFRNCTIHSKSNSYITAASTPERVKYGYVFYNCKLTYANDVTKMFLGRPWRKFAKTVFIECDFGNLIASEGWKQWSNKDQLSTTYYAEYLCKGKSANREKRVSWSHELTQKEAQSYSIEKVFAGETSSVANELNWYK